MPEAMEASAAQLARFAADSWCRQRHAASDRQAVTERSGTRPDAGFARSEARDDLGVWAGALMTQRVDGAAGGIGAAVINVIGASMIVRSWDPLPSAGPVFAGARNRSVDRGAPLSSRATLGLAVALAVNNVITGVGAGAAGLSPVWTACRRGWCR